MATRFIAIGVPQGDAFFAEIEGRFTALVDGGRSAAGFACQFARATRCRGVDVLVCTHNDADHANGVAGFLRAGLPCREVWLPASWSGLLADVCLSPLNFVERLLDEVERLGEPDKTLAELGDRYAGDDPPSSAEASERGIACP